MNNKLYVNYVAGGVKDLDILMTYRCTEDEKVEVVHCMYGDEAKVMLGMIVPSTIVMDLELGTYYIECVRGMFDSKIFVYSKTGVHNPPLNIIKGPEALYVYHTLTGAPDDIRDIWPKTCIRHEPKFSPENIDGYGGHVYITTHNPYMNKNYFVPARHCGYSAARMFIDEFTYANNDIKALVNSIYGRKQTNIGPQIERVIFNAPATIVFWKDGTKTVVKAQGDDEFDPEKGLAMAICKKVLGNDRDYYEVFLKHVGRYEKQQRKAQEMLEKLGECANKGYLDSLADGIRRFAEAAGQVAPHMPGDSHDS